MSSAASRPSRPASPSTSAPAEGESAGTRSATSSHSTTPELRKPPSRTLMKPPARPAAPPPAQTATVTQTEPETPSAPPEPQRPGPISLPSEPMQYRAIGLLRGKYAAGDEQFNRGTLHTADGTPVDAVLLGRVTSLIKKHIDLEQDHLWVVYPRTLYKEIEEENETAADESAEEKTNKTETAETEDSTSEEDVSAQNAASGEASSDRHKGPVKRSRYKDDDDDRKPRIPALHVQIVGVWEPENLTEDFESLEEDERPLSSEEAAEQCDCFSIRGEVAKYDDDKKEIVISIVQKSKSETAKPKRPFKLLISGSLSGRTVGHFWDLTVERQSGELVLVEAKPVGVVPPKRKPKGKKGFRKRPSGGVGKYRSGGAPKPKPKAKVASDKPAADKAVSEKADGDTVMSASEQVAGATEPSAQPEAASVAEADPGEA